MDSVDGSVQRLVKMNLCVILSSMQQQVCTVYCKLHTHASQNVLNHLYSEFFVKNSYSVNCPERSYSANNL